MGDDLRELRRFRREQDDFDALFRAHYAEIVRYLSVRLGSRDDARELASEVFLEAFRRVPRLRWQGRPVLAWLYRVAANMAADAMKRRSRELPAPDVAAADEGRDRIEMLAERDALRRALAELSPQYQLLVHLRLVEGYSFAEVASLTGRTVGACQMALLRAGRQLQRSLEEEGIRAGA